MRTSNRFLILCAALTMAGLLAIPVGTAAVPVPTADPATPADGIGQVDHFVCYQAKFGKFRHQAVTLYDQFLTARAEVTRPVWFCNPVAKNGEPVVDETAHLTFYRVKSRAAEDAAGTVVLTTDQFGEQRLEVGKLRELAVPAQKLPLEAPTGIDHYACYDVDGDDVHLDVTLEDQWTSSEPVVGRAIRLCVPVAKAHDGVVTLIQHPEDHLLCYSLRKGARVDEKVTAVDQFGDLAVEARRQQRLCLPATKAVLGEPEHVDLVADPTVVVAGDTVTLRATARDAAGTVVVDPTLGVLVGLAEREALGTVQATDLGDGTYEATLTVNGPGTYALHGLAVEAAGGHKRTGVPVVPGAPLQVLAGAATGIGSVAWERAGPLTMHAVIGLVDGHANSVPDPDPSLVDVTSSTPGLLVGPPATVGDRVVVPLTVATWDAGQVAIGFAGGPPEVHDVYFPPALLRTTSEGGDGSGPAADGSFTVELDLLPAPGLAPTVTADVDFVPAPSMVQGFDAVIELSLGGIVPDGADTIDVVPETPLALEGCRALVPGLTVETCGPLMIGELGTALVPVSGFSAVPLPVEIVPTLAVDFLTPVGLGYEGWVRLSGVTLYDPFGWVIPYVDLFGLYWYWPLILKPVKTLNMHVYIVEGEATQAQVEADITAAENGFNANTLACRCPFYIDFVPTFTTIPKDDWDDIDEDGDGLDRYDANGDGDYADEGDNNDLFNAMMKDYYDVGPNTENVYYVPSIRGGAMGTTYAPNGQVAVDNGEDDDNLTLYHEKVHEMDLRKDGDFDVNDSPADAGNAQGARNDGNIMNYDKTGSDLTATQCGHLDP